MYVRHVSLRNIKGFEEADLTFCPDGASYEGWSVITGDNGAGKTALLKAMALALLGPDQVRALVPDLRGWVTEGERSGTISVEVKPHHDYDKTKRGGQPVKNTFWAEIEISSEGPLHSIAPTNIFRKRGQKHSATNGPWEQATPGWLSLGYGPFRRLYGSSPDAQRVMVLPGRIPHFATLFKEDATLAEGEEWLKQLNYKRLERQEHEGETLRTLLDLLSNDFLRQGVKIDDVDSNGFWLHDSAGRRMLLADMSDGYRSALAMLIDIFRHMADVYGTIDLVEVADDGICFVNKPGVVLIDEIDAHLHPAWQREIGFWLKQHFPFVQFIASTHSPLVCQAADSGRIYHLPQPGQGKPFLIDSDEYQAIISGKPDEILLSPAFGLPYTRSPRAVHARQRRARLVAKARNVPLNPSEENELEQLDLFVTAE
jgi:hypothetical protein